MYWDNPGCVQNQAFFDAVGNVVFPCHYVQKSFEMLFKLAPSVLGVGNPHFVLKTWSETLCPPILYTISVRNEGALPSGQIPRGIIYIYIFG